MNPPGIRWATITYQTTGGDVAHIELHDGHLIEIEVKYDNDVYGNLNVAPEPLEPRTILTTSGVTVKITAKQSHDTGNPLFTARGNSDQYRQRWIR